MLYVHYVYHESEPAVPMYVKKVTDSGYQYILN